MTVLDGMLPPPKPRNEALERLIEVTCQRVSMLDPADLARLAAHEYDEYDEEVAVPPPGSAGEKFLQDVARAFIGWLTREGRFPNREEMDDDVIASEVIWQQEQAGSVVAQVFVDLALHYSYHANVAQGADVQQLRMVLFQAASTLIFTLSEEYAPLV
jgi:hypothetical protein